jgi:hypothetical protein
MDALWIDGPDGNVEHIAEHDITTAEVQYVLNHPIATDISRSSGRPVIFGYTKAKRKLAVVYEPIDAITVYPITAYDVED